MAQQTTQTKQKPYLYLERFLMDFRKWVKDQPYQVCRPTTKAQAEAIVDIYRRATFDTYPYHEMLDPEYVYKTFSDPKYWWGFVTIDEEYVGCFTITIDYEHRTAYMRGLNIVPEYQGQGWGHFLGYELIRMFVDDKGDQVDKWYTEARTAHTAVQHLAYNIGARPYALFMFKDVFVGKKESDCMMAGYLNPSFLPENRQVPTSLPLFMEDCYEYIKTYHMKWDSQMTYLDYTGTYEKLDIDWAYVQKTLHQMYLKVEKTDYCYRQVHIVHESRNLALGGLITDTVKNMEKIRITGIESLEDFVVLYMGLLHVAHENKIEYCELTIPMQNELANLICQFLHEDGPMRLCGYLPGWQHDPITKKYHDMAIFSFERKSTTLEYRAPKLIPTAQELQTCLHLEDLESLIPNILGTDPEFIPASSAVL